MSLLSESHHESVSGLTRKLKQMALESGFQLAGTCRAITEETEHSTDLVEHAQAQSDAVYQNMLQRMYDWMQANYSAEMHYLSERWDAYCHPNLVLPNVRSFLVLAAEYRTLMPAPSAVGCGRIASYAWGDDYHDVLRRRMKPVLQQHRQMAPTYAVRGCVDTAPLSEKFLAVRAGLGSQGRNTLLIHPRYGSRLVLAVIASTAVLEYDEDALYFYDDGKNDRKNGKYPNECDDMTSKDAPIDGRTPDTSAQSEWNPCMGCEACVRACPTSALTERGLDARRCLSYWTIENRATIPAELQPLLGDRLFGCEVCQEVCRWNRTADATRTPTNVMEKIASERTNDETSTMEKNDPKSPFAPRDGENPLTLETLFSMDEDEFKRRFRGSPLLRPGLEKLRDTAAMIQKVQK